MGARGHILPPKKAGRNSRGIEERVHVMYGLFVSCLSKKSILQPYLPFTWLLTFLPQQYLDELTPFLHSPEDVMSEKSHLPLLDDHKPLR